MRQVILTIIFVIACGIEQPSAGADYRLFVLAGQSNMEGYGTVAELSPSLRGPVPRCFIYCGQTRADGDVPDGVGAWTQLTPGFGSGFRTDGRTNYIDNHFGPELMFAWRMNELRPDEGFAIVKYSRGGSSLDVRGAEPWGTWDPEDDREMGGLRRMNQYDHALATLRRALQVTDIDGDGEADTLVPAGIVWMQGETDATVREAADAYHKNLAELIALRREAVGVVDLPVVIGRISDRGVREGTERVWAFGDTVRAAQEHVAADDAGVDLVTSTDGYDYSDPFHYDSAGYLDLGRRFAEAMHEAIEAASNESD
ncbi:MAG: sialate O-acetylesterase [Planctomycetota bacterium]